VNPPVRSRPCPQELAATNFANSNREAMMSRILIIDDDVDFSRFLSEALKAHAHRVDCALRVKQGLEILADREFDVILLDNQLPGLSGLEALEEFRKREIGIPVIMMTGQGTTDTVIKAYLLGAFDYVVKDIDIEQLVERLEPKIRRADETGKDPIPNKERDDAGGHRLLGKSEPMLDVYKQIGQVAASVLAVLIQGETGTGKELVARAIHDNSPRRDKPFVPLNVAALTESLLESELFGHEKGAFSGADSFQKGCFEFADGGTLFLDEIGEMPPALQAKLLRVLAADGAQEVRRIGSNTPIQVDVRVVCATNRDLLAEMEKGTFRPDLYNRLAGFPIALPPLRDRGPDLALLGRHFRIRAAREANRPVPALHPRAVELLRAYSWPGNVRELTNVLTRAVLRCRGAEILPEHLALPTEGDTDATDFGAAIEQAWESREPNPHQTLHDQLDRDLIRFALAKCGGNQTQVAERLGLSRNFVRKLAQKFGLE
jgi:DNA-binding NtrC family response regulator